jgi:hypothetical protein
MLDVKNDKWFVRVANKQEADAAQEWAFKEGLSWNGRTTLRRDYSEWDMVGGTAIGSGHCEGGLLGQAGVMYWSRSGHKEIKVTFQTALSVDTVVLPEVESPQQKQIKALEATIAQAAAQIQKLKEEV